jgi:tryptophan synthase alpha chain
MMNNKLTALFQTQNKNLLNVYCTAGFPKKESTTEVLLALQKSGVDMIEVGMPYSDPIADGPVIQDSNMIAIANGMTIELLFKQLKAVKKEIQVPLILMGYLNPVMQYGLEKFCADAASAGVAGLILPDLPMYEFENIYKKYFTQNNLSLIFLITPQTSEERIKKADALSSGFLYAVSSNSVTGSTLSNEGQNDYFKKLATMKLQNPLMIGFGINSKETFTNACKYAVGAIVGSAYIKAISKAKNVQTATANFIKTLH